MVLYGPINKNARNTQEQKKYTKSGLLALRCYSLNVKNDDFDKQTWCGVSSFVELGWRVGDGGERQHDEVWIGFDPSRRWMMHDVLVPMGDCTADSLFCSP